VGSSAATSGITDGNGLAKFEILQEITYQIEAEIWVGTEGQNEVARSGAALVTPGSEPIRLKLALDKRTKNY
jgi:hypothetical protein